MDVRAGRSGNIGASMCGSPSENVIFTSQTRACINIGVSMCESSSENFILTSQAGIRINIGESMCGSRSVNVILTSEAEARINNKNETKQLYNIDNLTYTRPHTHTHTHTYRHVKNKGIDSYR